MGKRIVISASPAVWQFACVIHLGGLLMSWITPFSMPLSCLATLFLIFSLFDIRRRFYWHPERITGLLFSGSDRYYLLLADGQELEMRLKKNALMSACLCILHFEGDAGRRSLILTADNVDQDDFRRLRISLLAAHAA